MDGSKEIFLAALFGVYHQFHILNEEYGVCDMDCEIIFPS